MKKVAFFVVFVVCLVMLLWPQGANAGTFVGTYCFNLTDSTDIFVWNVEAIDAGGFTTVTVTGVNISGNRGMSGGGSIVGNNLVLSVNEAGDFISDAGQLHSIVIDLTTSDLAGTDDIVFHRFDNTHLILTQSITLVTCPLF